MTLRRRKIQKVVFLTVVSIIVNTIYLMRFGRKDFFVELSSQRTEEEFHHSSTELISPLEELQNNFQKTLDRFSKSTLDEELKERMGRRSELAAINCHSMPFLLIQVHSKPSNFLSRQAIRLSWGKPENTINRGSWTKPER